ncbi:MAG: hypothetical protein KBE09_02625 [Candidatus Pacebacteria bacterium]|nr:hypothetical protein [Candidatus Paceibacterota bacterium]
MDVRDTKNDPSGMLNGREKRILMLAGVFFLGGVMFFFLHFERAAQYPEAVYFPPAPKTAPPSASRGQSPFLSYPEASSFDHFVFKKDVPIKDLYIKCDDAFAAVLVYAAGVDYRTHLLDAKYNVAHACTPGTETAIAIDLSNRPLIDGQEYYVIRAQQGPEGEWYNPY